MHESAPSEYYAFHRNHDGTMVVDETDDLQLRLAGERQSVEVVTLLDDLWVGNCHDVPRRPLLEITVFGQKWFKHVFEDLAAFIMHGSFHERLAKKVVAEFDEVENDPAEYVEVTTDRQETVVETGGVEITRVVKEKKRTKLCKGKRTKFAVSIAKLAYLKYGARPMSPANIIVTRKWIVKLLDSDYPDLRTADKIVAVDRALFLSFVPSKDFLEMEMVMGTHAVSDRFNFAQQNFLGKIFRVSGSFDQ